MVTPVWLPAFPQLPDAKSWGWAPQENKIVFQPPVGPSISRRRATARVINHSGTFSLFSGAEMIAFEEWYADELADGALHYIWEDPISKVLAKWKIKSYRFQSAGGDFYQLSLEVNRLPGAAV